MCEHETSIVKQIVYHEESDILSGFCGLKDSDMPHTCLEDPSVTVGDDKGYDNIIEAFQNSLIATNARAILLNPLCEHLPKLPILVMATCIRFNHIFVQKQWSMIKELYDQFIKPVLGPLVANSSDGDSRRRKLFLQSMSKVGGNRFQPISRELGFVLTAKKIIENVGYSLSDPCDPDFIHNHKKLVNLLDSDARVLQMGASIVHINHLHQVYECLPVESHGLARTDIDRDDRQTGVRLNEFRSVKSNRVWKFNS